MAVSSLGRFVLEFPISHIQPGTVNVKLNLSVVENLFYCFHALRAMAQVFIFVFFYVVLYPEILTLKKNDTLFLYGARARGESCGSGTV